MRDVAAENVGSKANHNGPTNITIFYANVFSALQKRYICKQLPLSYQSLRLPALPLPNSFTEILLVQYDQYVGSASVNRNFFSTSLKGLGQT